MSDKTMTDPDASIATPDTAPEQRMDDDTRNAGTTDFDEDALGEAYDEGLAAERGGDLAAAVAAYRRCLSIDPADHCGVRIRLAGRGRDAAKRGRRLCRDAVRPACRSL